MRVMESYQHNEPVSNVIANLKNKNNLPATFSEVNNIINGVNYFADVMKMIEQGLIPILMAFLRDGLFLR